MECSLDLCGKYVLLFIHLNTNFYASYIYEPFFEGEANYTTTLEKSLTLAKEFEQSRSKFDNLQR
jgi:hypothetical protein